MHSHQVYLSMPPDHQPPLQTLPHHLYLLEKQKRRCHMLRKIL